MDSAGDSMAIRLQVENCVFDSEEAEEIGFSFLLSERFLEFPSFCTEIWHGRGRGVGFAPESQIRNQEFTKSSGLSGDGLAPFLASPGLL